MAGRKHGHGGLLGGALCNDRCRERLEAVEAVEWPPLVGDTQSRSGTGPMPPTSMSAPDLKAITLFLASTATHERSGLAYLDAAEPVNESETVGFGI